MMRGIRGATTVEENSSRAIHEATSELLLAMLDANGIGRGPADFEPLCSVIFTVTPDLDAAFPAEAARAVGMTAVPLLNALEIPVPGRLQRVVRVMMHLNTDRTQAEVRHVYLREAASLRPDLVSAQ